MTATKLPELLSWIVDGQPADAAVARQHAERLAQLRRDGVPRPTIFVGAGTCGLGAGAKETLAALHEYLDNHEVKADVVMVGCVGLCSMEPIVDVQLPGRTRVSYKQITARKAAPLLDAALAGSVPDDMVLGQFRNAALQPWPDVPYLDEHPFFAPQTRWVLANCGVIDPSQIEEYIARGGYAPLVKVLREMTPEAVCDMVEQSGLRGRGGGGFPTGKKWKFARQSAGDQKYLICNADEGDPGAFMDRAVIESDPHRLVEGMAIAAYGIGATKAYVYIRAEYPLAIKRLKAALAQAEANGLLGHDILGSGVDLKVIIKMGAGAFVCGEETALIHSIEGKRGMPRPRPPFPAVSGLFGKPTIINNVETLANLPTVVAGGAAAFSVLGTKTSKGTKVFALSGKVSRQGLQGRANRRSLRRLHSLPALGHRRRLRVAQDRRRDHGLGRPGRDGRRHLHGRRGQVLHGLHPAGKLRQVHPRREGTRRMLEILQRITRGRKRERGIEALERFKSVLHLQSLAETIRDSSLCGLGQTAPNPVLSTLRWFRDEYEAHIYERSCPAAACAELVTYSIDAEKCKGCTVCAKKCPVGAIVGAAKSPHHIVIDKCIGCGSCVDACRFEAVMKQ
jgi:NADH:ubiquinone oxidoreductase subunit F (NADH-binding)/Pyruvate/2-oxoacid:ferredoxin oxidoreductase delta subunit/(2Fe-2S) ferredoxin